MRIRSFITLVAMLGAPLFAGGEVGYYAIGYSNTGTSHATADSSAVTAAGCPSTVASSAPQTTPSTPIETSAPVETGSTTSASNDGEKVWAAKAAFAIPFVTRDVHLYDNFSFSLGIKRFLPTDIPNLTVPLEAELTYIWLSGEFDNSFGEDYFNGFNIDLYINALARYSPVSFFYVEAGLEIGFTIIPEIRGDRYDYDDIFRFGMPIGFGFKLLDTFEIGQRFIFGIPDYSYFFGSLFRYEIVSVSYLF